MSNFTGVTFAQQKVLPSDDAIIRRVILPDGILYGCELSYSGSTLTMAAGQMLICGRQIRHPSSQNWAVVDATSGFARLLLTVDLTRTSTKEVFEQVVDSIEYAAAEDGFPELEQSDVNVSGSRYQVVACVVSLGTGGITGVVTQLPPSRVEGGGGLNFSVVGGPTQPANPKENTIWVITDIPITSYIFSATESEAPVEGTVWITTGASSTVAFSATKKNPVMVYPISAKQYVGGAWVDKTAKIYQGGAWQSLFSEIYIVKYGVLNDVAMAVDRTGNTVTQGSGYVAFAALKNHIGVFTTQDAIDLTPYKKLRITIISGRSYVVSGKSPGLVIGTSRPTSTANSSASITNVIAFKAFDVSADENTRAVIPGTYELDVTDYKGEHYVGIIFGGSNYIDYPYVNVKEFALV